MKRSSKPTRKRSAKRDLFAELSEGMNALDDARHGKRTLRDSVVCLSLRSENSPAPLGEYQRKEGVTGGKQQIEFASKSV